MQTSNKNRKKLYPLIRNNWFRFQTNSHITNIFLLLISYVVITLWLNSIRTSTSSSLVLFLAVAEGILYLLIFLESHQHLKKYGYKVLSFTPLPLFVIGRVGNRETFTLLINVFLILILSFRKKSW